MSGVPSVRSSRFPLASMGGPVCLLLRLPLPWPVVAMLANFFMGANLFEAALVTLLSFFAFFRPGEPFRLLAKHVCPPIAGAGRAHQFWSLTLHAFEEGTPSKTSEYDESVLLDMEYSSFLGPLLGRLAATRPPGAPLFSMSQMGHQTELRTVYSDRRRIC